MESLLGILIGLGLAASCGFRVFAPLLVIGIAGHTGQLHLAEDFSWIASYPAIAAFSVATLLEVLGYFIPGVDHALDVLTTPASVFAGSVASASMISDLSPFLTWSLAIVAGGGIAGVVQVGTVKLRAVSGVTTAGLGNPVVAAGELAGAVGISFAAILIPVIAFLLLMVFLGYLLWLLLRKERAQSPVNS